MPCETCLIRNACSTIIGCSDKKRPPCASEQGESPATDRQQLNAAIALLRRWIDSGSDNIIISDTYHFLNNDATAAV
jgi:hypothetical protein